MRENKFRGKRMSDNKWVYGSLVYSENIEPAIYFEVGKGKVKTMDWCYIAPNTVCQFSGLHDINGKEIYEGDILRSSIYPFSLEDDGEKDNYMGVVFYADDEMMWRIMMFVTKHSSVRGISNFIDQQMYEISETNITKLEVVGNIFDNKGLFRETDEVIMHWFYS